MKDYATRPGDRCGAETPNIALVSVASVRIVECRSSARCFHYSLAMAISPPRRKKGYTRKGCGPLYESRQIAAGQLDANRPLVDMPNDDAAPVNVGAGAASQLHIFEKDYGHTLLAL